MRNIVSRFVEKAEMRRRDTVFVLHGCHQDGVTVEQGLDSISVSSLQQLTRHMKTMAEPSTVDEIATTPAKHPRFAVTFDDGYASVVENAMSVLEAESVVASMFVCGAAMRGEVLWRDMMRFVINQGLAPEFLLFCSSKQSKVGELGEDTLYRETKKAEFVKSRHVHELLIEFAASQKIEHEEMLLAGTRYCTPENVQTWLAGGHVIGNHTTNHYVLSSLSSDEQRQEIQSTHAVISKLSNIKLSNVLSVPFGGVSTVNTETVEVARSLGYHTLLMSTIRRSELAEMKTSNRGIHILRRRPAEVVFG